MSKTYSGRQLINYASKIFVLSVLHWQRLVQVTKDLPEAMAVMGFAFYVAPMLLPLRAEMPPGNPLLDTLCFKGLAGSCSPQTSEPSC